ncbi:heavy metal translocating P-type ATPase [Candidatus Kuenenia sp.]|uniref:heavy metal translocating P-type ATPase n=1 Tax=Candidatus Kuenenia sp. TaxID=2499824 RepID=UPI00322093AA
MPPYSYSDCVHCGKTIAKKEDAIINANGAIFCCWGCETVYSILKKEHFSLINKPHAGSSEYDILDNESFLRDYSVLQDGRQGMRFFVEGVQCTSCLWIIDQIPHWIPEVETVHLNMSQNTLFVSLKSPGFFGKVVSTLAALGYKTYPIRNTGEARHFQKKENHRHLMRLGVAGACAGSIMLYSFALYSGLTGPMAQVFQYINLAFFLPVLFYCARPFYINLWRSFRAWRPSIDLPIVLAVAIGFVLSLLHLIQGRQDFYFDSLSVLIFLLLASRYLLSRTQQKFLNSSYLLSFFEAQICRRWNEGRHAYEKVSASHLNTGDKILVNEGERIPADGEMINDWVNINPSVLTGESLPQKLFKGAKIYAGTKVVSGYAEILIEHTTGGSRIGRILKKVEEQIYNKTPLISLTDKAAHYFTLFILSLGMLFFLFYSVIDIAEAVRRTLALIILACPCALAFATPLTQSLSLKKASKKGYLIKNAESLEKLSRVKNVFFDKTGTLTQGQFEFLKWKSLQSGESVNFVPDTITLNAIYSIETHSQHPIARALVKQLEKVCDVKLPVCSLKEIPGKGISGTVEDNHYKLISALPDDGNDDSGIIASTVAIYRNELLVAYACLGDKLRKDAKETITALKKSGIKPHIVSGDNDSTVRNVAKKLELADDSIYAGVSPEEKSTIVNTVSNALMVGDGVNDALAMSSCSIGIAVQGSVEASLVAADIYSAKEGVSPVLDLILLSKNTLSIIKRNLVISFLYNFAGGIAALFGVISPLVAAILMPVSSLVILLSTVAGTKFTRKFNKWLPTNIR